MVGDSDRRQGREGGVSERGEGRGGRSTTVSDLLSSEAVFEPGQIRRNQCKNLGEFVMQ